MCGISALIARGDYHVAGDLIYSLVIQGYRGEERCGIAVSLHGRMMVKSDNGSALDVFKDGEELAAYLGAAGIAHNSCHREGCQPFFYQNGSTQTAYCADAPSEIVHELAQIIDGSRYINSAIQEAMHRIDYPFALLVMRGETVVVARSSGLKPLAYGRIRNHAHGFFAASQIDVFEGASFLGSVMPGEMVVLNSRQKPQRIAVLRNPDMARCLNELIFLRRPDKEYAKHEVDQLRILIGHQCGKKYRKNIGLDRPFSEYVVVPVIEGGKFYAIGVARELGLFYNPGAMHKPRYPRAPWMPKYTDTNFIPEAVEGKVIILVTDQLHSGHELQILAERCRTKGASEVHAIAATMLLKDCPYENAFAHQSNPIGARLESSAICQELTLDSLTVLEADELVRCIGIPERIHCTDCLRP